jgi:hypothetical protein
MSFFSSLSVRIPLALIGGFLYGLLTYLIVQFLGLPGFAVPASGLVFLLYVGSRLVLLFSGVDSPYYSKRTEAGPQEALQGNPFHETAQWVGRFYHYHDLVLFAFLGMTSITFIIVTIVDLSAGRPWDSTFRELLEVLSPFP